MYVCIYIIMCSGSGSTDTHTYICTCVCLSVCTCSLSGPPRPATHWYYQLPTCSHHQTHKHKWYENPTPSFHLRRLQVGALCWVPRCYMKDLVISPIQGQVHLIPRAIKCYPLEAHVRLTQTTQRQGPYIRYEPTTPTLQNNFSIFTHLPTHTSTHSHPPTRQPIHTHPHTPTHTHTHTHTPTHTHPHTHTHTHLYPYCCSRHPQNPLSFQPVLLQELNGLMDKEWDLYVIHSLPVQLYQDVQRDSKHTVVCGRGGGGGRV